MSEKKPSRMKMVSRDSKSMVQMTVLQDMETGVQYLYVVAGYGAGLTPLIDANGKPVIGPNFDDQAEQR